MYNMHNIYIYTYVVRSFSKDLKEVHSQNGPRLVCALAVSEVANADFFFAHFRIYKNYIVLRRSLFKEPEFAE